MAYTQKWMQKRFEIFCQEMRLVTGQSVGRVGVCNLDWLLGKVEIQQTINALGGVRVINGQRMSSSELVAWMDGALWAQRQQSKVT